LDINTITTEDGTKQIKNVVRERKMDIQLNDEGYCKVNVKYKADTDTVKEKRQYVAKEMAKSYEVKGFRKGKASPEVIRLSYPKEVEAYLKQEMLNQAFTDVVSEKGIKPFGGPQISSSTIEGNLFEAEFSVHTLPEFELKQYKGFEIPKYAATTTVDELSQKMLQELRTEHAEDVPYGENDFVQAGDKVVLQYHSFLDEAPIEELSSEGVILKIGQTNIPGFDDNLLGMKNEEEREFVLRTPKDFNEKFADKLITFKVKLMMGSKSNLAGLDDELAKKIGLETFASLMEEVGSVASAKLQGHENGHYQEQVGRRLIAEHDFVVPQWIADPEAKVQAQMQKKSWDTLSDEEKQKLTKDAEEGIKLSLILTKIQENEPDAQLHDDEVLKMARENLSKYTKNPDEVMQDVINKGQLPMFFSRIRDEHTLGFVVKNSTIIE
jgi:trigger factor